MLTQYDELRVGPSQESIEEFKAKPAEPVATGNHNSGDIACINSIEETVEPFAGVVKRGTDVFDDFGNSVFSSDLSFLLFEVFFLGGMTDSCVSDDVSFGVDMYGSRLSKLTSDIVNIVKSFISAWAYRSNLSTLCPSPESWGSNGDVKSGGNLVCWQVLILHFYIKSFLLKDLIKLKNVFIR